jgi:hypothetical protein
MSFKITNPQNVPAGDATAPVISSITAVTTSTSLTNSYLVNATDNVAVTDVIALVSGSTAPLANNAGWVSGLTASLTFADAGTGNYIADLYAKMRQVMLV